MRAGSSLPHVERESTQKQTHTHASCRLADDRTEWVELVCRFVIKHVLVRGSPSTDRKKLKKETAPKAGASWRGREDKVALKTIENHTDVVSSGPRGKYARKRKLQISCLPSCLYKVNYS